jgi:multiple sugar transport system substrate-binding protein
VITLRGITCQHDRGLAPMFATASRFAETHPGIRIEWEARSLQGFAGNPIRHLAEQYDLIVLDHPFMGTVARDGYLIPLDKHVSAEVLAILRTESVGASHDSYFYDGHHWALAIDGAAQVAGYRPDLLKAASATVPKTWHEVFALARVGRGFVTTPLLPVDSLCGFFTLCASSGEPPFASDSAKVVSDRTGETALHRLQDLAECGPAEALEWNPIKVWEKMSTTDEIAFCPLGFGYSNYARAGYRKSRIQFANIPASGRGGPAGSVLGGAGLAISAQCKGLSAALEYATWVASGECQRTLYVQSGGQPGNRNAWIDPEVNSIMNHFFETTLPTLEQAYVRPRFPGFVEFQTEASLLISDFLHGKNGSTTSLRLVDECYCGWASRRSP